MLDVDIEPLESMSFILLKQLQIRVLGFVLTRLDRLELDTGRVDQLHHIRKGVGTASVVRDFDDQGVRIAHLGRDAIQFVDLLDQATDFFGGSIQFQGNIPTPQPLFHIAHRTAEDHFSFVHDAT